MKSKTLNEAVIDRINLLLSGDISSQYSLAEASGVPYPTIKSIMQRRTKGITLKTVALVARAFGMSISEFFDDDSFAFDKLELDE